MPRGSVDRKNHYMTWYQRALNKRIGERVCRNGTVPGKQPIIQLVSTKAIPTPLVIVSAEGGFQAKPQEHKFQLRTFVSGFLAVYRSIYLTGNRALYVRIPGI